jgi:hypothetical protein
MPPALLPIMMVLYSIYHNGPDFIRHIHALRRLWKKAPPRRKFLLVSSTIVAAVMVISPIAFYGEHAVEVAVV